MNGEFIDFLAETANEIDEALINNPQLKSSMIKHAEKLTTEAEKYLEYINGEYQKAAKKGYTKHDEQPKGKGWFWYSSYSKNTTYYFPQNGLDGMVTFWMKGEPKPDPLNYLFSMVRDCVGELYKGLEINDYRCFFLACIYDAQRIAAGQERIYFEPQDTKELKNRICSNVWQKLAGWKYHTVKILQNLQQTIKAALQAIKANLKQETKRELGEMHKWYQTNTFKFVVIPLVVALFLGIPTWLSLGNKTDHSPTASTSIFADVSKDGSILRSNNFPWDIEKTKDKDGNILYTIVDRRGDATAVSVVPDNPKYTVYQSWGGMVIKYTCPEEKISNFTIKLKY